MADKRQKKTVEIRRGIPQLTGVVKVGTGYNFSASLGNFQEARLLLYKKGNHNIFQEIPITKEYCFGERISLWVGGIDTMQLEYLYQVDGTLVVDPYAKAVTGRGQFGKSEEERYELGMRGVVCGEKTPSSQIESVFIPYQDMILYKLHVRGYTMSRSSKVKKKGTFSGLVEKIPYLKELGITSVELMPAYDFVEMPTGQSKVNFWGYTGGFYFAPKSAYCAGKDSIAEFQWFIDSFHENNLEVLMEFYFPKTMNPLLIVDILRHWKCFYHVDGFHLVGEQIPIDIILQDEILKETKILYDGMQQQHIMTRKDQEDIFLAEYRSDFMRTMRCFMKGDSGHAEGFVWHNRHYKKKCGVIHYLTNQDGFTLADLVSYNERHNDANGEENRDGVRDNYSWNCGVEGDTKKSLILELRKKQMKNAILLLMLSQGTPMLYAGDEFGNSQQGNNNAWCQDNDIGWVEWNKNKRSEEMLTFVKAAIAFRKSHPILHLDRAIQDNDYLASGFPEISYHSDKAWLLEANEYCRSVGIMYGGAYDHGEHLYIAYNMHWQSYSFALPHLQEQMKWYQVCGSVFLDESLLLENEREFVAPPRSISILIGK